MTLTRPRGNVSDKLRRTRLCLYHLSVIFSNADDPLVIAGQATVGVEILRQVKGRIDAVFVCCGGKPLLIKAEGYWPESRRTSREFDLPSK
jgi:hypothetical protein